MLVYYIGIVLTLYILQCKAIAHVSTIPISGRLLSEMNHASVATFSGKVIPRYIKGIVRR